MASMKEEDANACGKHSFWGEGGEKEMRAELVFLCGDGL